MSNSFANREVAQAAARHILAKLVDLHVPVSTEYMRSLVVLSVPRTYARALDVACDEVAQALADGATPGAYS